MKAGEEEEELISSIITRMFVEQPLDLLIIQNSPCCRPILFCGWVQSCIILGTQTNKRTNKQTKKQIYYLCYSGWVQKWLCCSWCLCWSNGAGWPPLWVSSLGTAWLLHDLSLLGTGWGQSTLAATLLLQAWPDVCRCKALNNTSNTV